MSQVGMDGQGGQIPPVQVSLPQKCRAGAGWFSAAWIKMFSSDESIAKTVCERLKNGTMDAETLRWFSPKQLKLIESEVIKDQSTIEKIETLFEQTLLLAGEMGHSTEKLLVLSSVCNDLIKEISVPLSVETLERKDKDLEAVDEHFLGASLDPFAYEDETEEDSFVSAQSKIEKAISKPRGPDRTNTLRDIFKPLLEKDIDKSIELMVLIDRWEDRRCLVEDIIKLAKEKEISQAIEIINKIPAEHAFLMKRNALTEIFEPLIESDLEKAIDLTSNIKDEDGYGDDIFRDIAQTLIKKEEKEPSAETANIERAIEIVSRIPATGSSRDAGFLEIIEGLLERKKFDEAIAVAEKVQGDDFYLLDIVFENLLENNIDTSEYIDKISDNENKIKIRAFIEENRK